MRNDECTIIIETKEGNLRRVYKKSHDGWTNTLPDGTIYDMTSEQFLSHLLPVLVDDYDGPLIVKVVKNKQEN